MTSQKRVIGLGDGLTLEDLKAVADGEASLTLPDSERALVERSRGFVANLTAKGASAPNVYGINTGFGALAETRIAEGDVRKLQQNLVRSHAAGVGEPLPTRVVRAMMALRAQVLSRGHSGVRPEVIELLLTMLGRGVHPVIPSQGSVGASGDLAPLAHLALVLIGEGRAEFEGTIVSGAEALKRAGLAPVVLEAKEGLALINGTQLMLAVGTLALLEAESLVKHADLSGALSVDALEGSLRPFDERIQNARPHPGQAVSAQNLRALLAGSEIAESHRDCKKVQDPYSLRCMPQVHGAVRDALSFVRVTLERELMASTDNPLIFADEDGTADVISGGNFHGEPLALALDFAAIATAELASIAERRIELLVNPTMSTGLPPFLAPHSGLDSGFMMVHVTASALVSENKVLAHPASVDSIPTSAGKEDHVSMGSISARKFAKVVEHTRTVLAIEALIASQGLDLRAPLRGGLGVRAAHAAIREVVPSLTEDREPSPDIEAVLKLFSSDTLLGRVAQATTSLN